MSLSLSEKGDIAFSPDKPLDESCYREAKNSDIYVLIVGGRYGSEASRTKKEESEAKSFYKAYESVTRQEYKAAAAEKYLSSFWLKKQFTTNTKLTSITRITTELSMPM
jgi:hypothetical protein